MLDPVPATTTRARVNNSPQALGFTGAVSVMRWTARWKFLRGRWAVPVTVWFEHDAEQRAAHRPAVEAKSSMKESSASTRGRARRKPAFRLV